MLETITAVNQAVNSFIWGIPAMVCIIGVGLLLSVRTGFLQLRKFPYAIKTIIGRIFRKKDASDGAMTPFQAVCTALAATVGTGNIAGVAGAIAIGGPGAVFWMWCSALLGMCTKFSEVTLAVHFRERNKNGELVGGPMYYIKNGLGSRWQFLAVLYSLFGVLTVFGTGNATQVNTIVTAIDSALLAYGISLACGIAPTRFALSTVPALGILPVLQVALLGVACAAVTRLFCLLLHVAEHQLPKRLPNPWVRVVLGGVVVVALSYLMGVGRYNGAGMGVITAAVEQGQALPWDFICKMLLTALTLSAGFKGGEVVPSFYIGATFGCAFGPLLGLPAGFSAAVGLVSVFCGASNTLIPSILLAYELFGGVGLELIALGCGVCYMLSGTHGLYSSQLFVTEKLLSEYTESWGKRLHH